ncbi:MAG TPA: 23S rRNA pseudouridine(1911/1915/1917) synthase RluD [Gammaproteobacteria bacterium]|nr:23S rRNA pseudouridine(1911/1915/1917) synthase RluD [Gammaproteobacteria bacterium]
MTEKIHLHLIIPNEMGGNRLDQVIAKLLPDYSRTQIQAWIKKARITVNDKPCKPRDTVMGGENIMIDAERKTQPAFQAQPIDLNIVYEDDALLVINKPVGMVVHPAAGNPDSTLLNALLHHVPALKELPRAGIMHRLDKDTSGLLVIAKTWASLTHLTAQMKSRTIHRIYQAIVCGLLTSGGKVDEPIGRHPVQRKRMTVIETGKPSVTHFRVIERYRNHTRIRVQLETGRTHQIRVHMAHIRYPLLGDPVYGGRLQLPRGASPALVDILRRFKRQALHASELGLIHPVTEKEMHWQAPLPDDLQELIRILKEDTRSLFEENK